VDADPSASQKIALLKLIRKFPELAKEIGIKDVDQDVRKLLLQDAAKGCDLDYEDDIKPWIGNRVGIAYDAKLETPIIAVQISNEGKARTGINKLADCGGSDQKTGIAFLDGYAIVTPQKADAAKVSAAAAKKSLADNPAYVKDVDALGDEGVFSAWADFQGVASIDEVSEMLGPDAEDIFAGASTAAVTLRATSSSLELATIGHLDKAPEVVKTTNIADLPADTALALSISGFGDAAAEQFESGLEELEADGIDDDLASFEKEFGLKIPEDIETLLGDGLTLAVGDRNLETLPMMSGPEDIAQLDVGLKLTTDPTKGADLAQRLVDLAAEVGITLISTPADDGVVISTNPGAAEAFTGDGGLGKSEKFKKAVAHQGGDPGLFINIDSIVDALLASNPPPDVEDMLNELGPLSAFAVSSDFDDKLFKATLRLTLE
ncbi:MAG: hypothetical protein ABIN55_09990, partial [Aeromicrobium sp.]